MAAERFAGHQYRNRAMAARICDLDHAPAVQRLAGAVENRLRVVFLRLMPRPRGYRPTSAASARTVADGIRTSLRDPALDICRRDWPDCGHYKIRGLR